MEVTKSRNAIEHNRACDPCRAHKVRCFPDSSSLALSKICQRCARTERNCVYTAPQRRKQRKRTDTRVAELEREVQAMRLLFEGKGDKVQATQAQPTTTKGASGNRAVSESANASIILPSTSASPPPLPFTEQLQLPQLSISQHAQLPSTPAIQILDVIDRGIISMDLAAELFYTYLTDLVPHYPVVVCPSGVTAAEIRKTKPTLFLAIIAAASGKSDPHLYSILNSEVISAYAQKIVIGSQKSVELVQAMIVTSVWYYPPGKFSQLKFYEYIHMAATMALDLGLGTNPNTASRRRRRAADTQSPASDDSSNRDFDDIERRRTFLSCYLITTGVSMSMRRPAMLRNNSWLIDCIDVLETSPDAVASDKILIGWVRLLIIAEETSTSLSFDDPGNMPSLSEHRVQLMLKSFEKRLEIWKDNLEIAGKENDALILAYHHNKIFLHELGLHEDHAPEDFLPPFTIDQILTPDPERKVTSSYVEAISVCVSSAHSLFERMLGMSIESLRALPVFNFVRMAYAAIVLIKLYISVRSTISQIGTFIDRESLRISIYIPAMIDRLSQAVGPMQCRSPATFLGLLVRLHAWYENQELHKEFTGSVQLFGLDHFTPPTANGTQDANTEQTNSEGSVSELAQISVGYQPVDPIQVQFGRLESLKDSYTPAGVRATSGVSSTQTSSLELKNNSLFDPAQIDFDFDPYLFPEDMDFMDVGANEWLSNMDLSGGNGGSGPHT